MFSTRGPRWAGSDGALLRTLLPDGRVLWAFGDTFVGQVAPTGALATAEVPGMVANTFQVQDGACFTPIIGGAPGSPSAVFTPPDPTTIFWPFDGYFDPVRNQVVVDSLEIRRGTFTIVAMDELYFSWPGLVPQGSARLPFPVSPTAPPYEETTLVDDGQVYLYSHLGASQYVARAPLGHAVSGPWHYWTGVDWSTTATSARPLVFVGPPTLAPLDVVAHQGRYLGVAKIWDVAGRNLLRYGVRVVQYVDPVGPTSAAMHPVIPQVVTPSLVGGPIVVSGHSSVTP